MLHLFRYAQSLRATTPLGRINTSVEPTAAGKEKAKHAGKKGKAEKPKKLTKAEIIIKESQEKKLREQKQELEEDWKRLEAELKANATLSTKERVRKMNSIIDRAQMHPELAVTIILERIKFFRILGLQK